MIGFESVNQSFFADGNVLFVAFRVRYLHADCFIYIEQPNQGALIHAFEAYCLAIGSECRPLGKELLAKDKVEVWNKIKMLTIISKWESEITAANIKRFVAVLSGYPVYALSEINSLDGFTGGRGLAYAFELVRIGRFRIENLSDDVLGGKTLISLPSKAV